MLTKRGRAILWSPVLVLLAFETYLSSQSRLPSLPLAFSHEDKLVHASYFFLTACFGVRAARFGEGLSLRRTAMLLVLGAALFGSLDELHQSFVPSRDADVFDVMADVSGAILATLFSERLLLRLGLDRTVR
jgi:VanZ family protein